jgi:hypothetical protein
VRVRAKWDASIIPKFTRIEQGVNVFNMTEQYPISTIRYTSNRIMTAAGSWRPFRLSEKTTDLSLAYEETLIMLPAHVPPGWRPHQLSYDDRAGHDYLCCTVGIWCDIFSEDKENDRLR